jgi:hypothetical protein
MFSDLGNYKFGTARKRRGREGRGERKNNKKKGTDVEEGE